MPSASVFLAGAGLVLSAVTLDRLAGPSSPTVWELGPEPARPHLAPPEARRRSLEGDETAALEESMPVNKWTPLYLTGASGRNRIVLAIHRLQPKKKADTTWTVVD